MAYREGASHLTKLIDELESASRTAVLTLIVFLVIDAILGWVAPSLMGFSTPIFGASFLPVEGIFLFFIPLVTFILAGLEIKEGAIAAAVLAGFLLLFNLVLPELQGGTMAINPLVVGVYFVGGSIPAFIGGLFGTWLWNRK